MSETQVNERDVEAIRDWLDKQSHLPKNFDDLVLRKFLYSCYCSLEQTKKCIEEFCTRRSNMPEIFTNRDPQTKRIQNVFSYTAVTTYMAGVDELVIHQMHDIPSYFDFYDCLKTFTLQADGWIHLERDVLPENHIVILDIKVYTLSLLSKVNIFYFQKLLLFLLETMPVRLKEVHIVNCPSFYEYMYNLVKPALPENLIKIINFHPDHLGLHKFIDKKYLPKEYDGNSESTADQNQFWINYIADKRQIFLDDNYWKADLTVKKVKNGGLDNSMNGSFRTLSID